MLEEHYNQLSFYHKVLFDFCLSYYDHQVDGGEPVISQQLDLIDFIKLQPIPEFYKQLEEDDEHYYEWLDENQEELNNLLNL